MNKENILNNVEYLPAEQLVDFIKNGIVSLDELRATGDLDATKRRKILEKLNKSSAEDDEFWETSSQTEDGCKKYLDEFPQGKHAPEARQKIESYESARIRIREQRDMILNELKINPNKFTRLEIKEFLQNETLVSRDLIDIGIPNAVLDGLNIEPKFDFKLGNAPDSIPEGFTEVYFWGKAGSGKTCALAGVLGTANNEGYLKMADGPGMDYMTKLKNTFRCAGDIGFLPPATSTEVTQYLPFELTRENEDPRSVSLIELSGEIFQCFYYKNANLAFPPGVSEKTLNQVLKLLEGNNRKIHFFFIDYEKENKLDSFGLCQADYLEAAARHFQNNNIFRSSTDAIYLVVTKSDLMDRYTENGKINLQAYLNDANFRSFVNALKTRCRENSINAGNLLAIHFSLGKVYFNDLCLFDDTTSQNIIDILMRRIRPNQTSILDILKE